MASGEAPRRCGRTTRDDPVGTTSPALITSRVRLIRQIARASAVVALGAIPAFLTGALAVQMRADFDLPASTLGLLVGLFFGCAAIASGPGGWAVQRLGARTGMRISFLGAGASMAGIALLAHDAGVLGIFLVIGGLSNALAHPSANLRLVRSIPVGRRALALGIKQAAIPTATLLAGLSVPVLALTVGWRWAFGAAAVAALLLAAVPDRGEVAAAASENPVRATPGGLSAAPSAGRLTMLLLTIGATLGIWGGQSLGTFLVSYAVDRGVTEAAAGLMLTVASLGGVFARVGAGWTIDRRRGSGLAELRVMLLVGAAGLLLLSTGIPALIWLGAIPAFAGGWGWTGVLTYVVVRTYPGAPAAATGVAQAGVFVGATVGVPVFGMVVEAATFATAWMATAASATAAVAIMTLAHRRLSGQARAGTGAPVGDAPV